MCQRTLLRGHASDRRVAGVDPPTENDTLMVCPIDVQSPLTPCSNGLAQSEAAEIDGAGAGPSAGFDDLLAAIVGRTAIVAMMAEFAGPAPTRTLRRRRCQGGIALGGVGRMLGCLT